jgi:predicted DNA binding CopG/RHH family protein
MKAVQKFTDAYLERCREMSSDDIVRFLDDFRRIHGNTRTKSRLISMKVPEDLLAAFKAKARLCGVPYQSRIKSLMIEWLREPVPAATRYTRKGLQQGKKGTEAK